MRTVWLLLFDFVSHGMTVLISNYNLLFLFTIRMGRIVLLQTLILENDWTNDRQLVNTTVVT